MAEEQQEFTTHEDDNTIKEDATYNDTTPVISELEQPHQPLYNPYSASNVSPVNHAISNTPATQTNLAFYANPPIHTNHVATTNLIDNDIVDSSASSHPLQAWVNKSNNADKSIPDLSEIPKLMGVKLTTVGNGVKGSAGNAVFYKTKPDDGNSTSKPRQFTVVMSGVDIAAARSKKTGSYYDVTGSLEGDYTQVLHYLTNDTKNMYNSLGNTNPAADIRTPVFNSTNGGMAFQVRVHETCKTREGKTVPSIKIFSLTTKDGGTYSEVLKHTDNAYLNYQGDMTVTFTLDTLILEPNMRCRLVATAKILALKSTNTRSVMGYNTIIARDSTGLEKHVDELSKVVTRPDQKNHMNNILSLLTQIAISGGDLGQVYGMISSVNRTPVYQDNTDKKIVASNIAPGQRRQQAPVQQANQAMISTQPLMAPQPMMQQQQQYPTFDVYNQGSQQPQYQQYQQQQQYNPYNQSFQQQQYQQPSNVSYGQPRYAKKD